jgi:8-oxo-dGTP diphosphatase
MATDATICFLIKENKVLLQKKSKELFGEGKWNGPGGKIKENESPMECAIRETLEEVSVSVRDFNKCGFLKFFKGDEPFFNCHVFSAKQFEGEPKSGREGVVKWFDFSEIPFNEMWPDDKIWMNLMLQGKQFEGEFYFDDTLNEILEYKLDVV